MISLSHLIREKLRHGRSNQTRLTSFTLILITAWVAISPKSNLVWRVYQNLPIPPDELKCGVHYPAKRGGGIEAALFPNRTSLNHCISTNPMPLHMENRRDARMTEKKSNPPDINAPSVSVIIPARNAEASIAATLDSVLTQDYAGPVEGIVADDTTRWCR